jgi:glycine/D-amino acid oxidase-like deaminating enzyme
MHMVRQSWGRRPPRILIVGAGISGAALAVMLRGVEAEINHCPQGERPHFMGWSIAMTGRRSGSSHQMGLVLQ